MVAEKFAKTDVLSIESGALEPRSKEYCSYIIEALETGIPFGFNGNVPNTGLITNLPQDCVVEVPVYADRNGLHPSVIGKLPTPLAAMNKTNLAVQDLMADAAINGDPELVFAAVAMDPLSGAVLSLKQIRDMCIEMMEAQGKWLPQFEGKKLRKIDKVNAGADVTPVPAPIDPALAINARFGKLAE
jgi:alpha-galactosidase